MVSLNLDKKTFLGPNFSPMNIASDFDFDDIFVSTMLMCRHTWHILKACKKSTESQYLFQLMVKMSFMKIPCQRTLDLNRSASITSDSHRKQTLQFEEVPYDIRRMRSNACPTITCLRIWIIHTHIVTNITLKSAWCL